MYLIIDQKHIHCTRHTITYLVTTGTQRSIKIQELIKIQSKYVLNCCYKAAVHRPHLLRHF